MKYCGNCGSTMDDIQLICGRCGTLAVSDTNSRASVEYPIANNTRKEKAEKKQVDSQTLTRQVLMQTVFIISIILVVLYAIRLSVEGANFKSISGYKNTVSFIADLVSLVFSAFALAASIFCLITSAINRKAGNLTTYKSIFAMSTVFCVCDIIYIVAINVFFAFSKTGDVGSSNMAAIFLIIAAFICTVSSCVSLAIFKNERSDAAKKEEEKEKPLQNYDNSPRQDGRIAEISIPNMERPKQGIRRDPKIKDGK